MASTHPIWGVDGVLTTDNPENAATTLKEWGVVGNSSGARWGENAATRLGWATIGLQNGIDG
ncbi:hypothetical protein MUNTM_51840 [Mycobacterium sp. MUNTM1]